MAAYAAEDSGLQDRVDAVLAEFPGGTQTKANEISWDGGQMILTLATGDDSFAARAVGSCATGYYCAYSGYNLSGSKLSFSACNTTQSTSAQRGSVHRKRTQQWIRPRKELEWFRPRDYWG
ncbi:peptidase inhibitor family I36 protein [Microbacterium aurum]